MKPRWKRVDAPGQFLFAELSVDPSARAGDEIRYADAEFLRLCEALYSRSQARLQEDEFLCDFPFSEMISAARLSQVAAYWLPRDDSASERGRAGSGYGQWLKAYIGRTVRLQNGLPLRVSYLPRRRVKKYRVSVGRFISLDSDEAQMRLLITAMEDAAIAQFQSAQMRVGRSVRSWEFTKADVRRLCQAADCFSSLDLDSPSGHSTLGRTLERFIGQIFQLPGGRLYRFTSNSRSGRARRYGIRIARGQEP